MCLGGKSVDGLLVRCRVARDMDFSVGHGLDCLGFPPKTEADFAEGFRVDKRRRAWDAALLCLTWCI